VLTRETIIKAAIRLLDEAGPGGFSMRSLAVALNVTPMALYHHAGSRDALLAAMSETVYAGVDDPPPRGSARAQIEALLFRYCGRVLAHPGMTMAIFADPRHFEGATERLTRQLSELLVATGLDTELARHWLYILIDYTHGFALAAAMSRGSPAASSETEVEPYRIQVGLLLDAAFGGAS
jgi:AcrR family transcriptional regulator